MCISNAYTSAAENPGEVIETLLDIIRKRDNVGYENKFVIGSFRQNVLLPLLMQFAQSSSVVSAIIRVNTTIIKKHFIQH